jgi:hypothetical protein
MSELRSSTETTEPATTDALAHTEADPGAGYDGHRVAQAAEDRLPLRQDAQTAWDADPGYDEADPDADYDGDLEALMADDRLPPRQAPGTASWDDDPCYDEAGLAAEHDGDPDALTADGHATATGEEHAPDGGEGDQAAPDDDPPATAGPGDPPAEASSTSTEAAPGQDDGNVTAAESSPAGASAATGSVADAGTGEQPGEASQAGQGDALSGQAAQRDAGNYSHDTAGAIDEQADPAGAGLAVDEPALAPQVQACADSTSAQTHRTDATEGGTEEAAAADASAMTQEDQPAGQGPVPDAGPGQQDAARTDTRPDQGDGEQLWAAVEQRLQALESDRDQQRKENSELRQEVSELKADRDASEARHQAEIDSIKAEYEARISDLEATAAAGQQEQQNPVGGPPDSGAQLGVPGSRDVTRPGEHRDAPVTGDGTGDDAGLADADAFDKSLTSGPDDTKVVPGRPIFSPEDVEFAKSTVELLQSAGFSLPGTDLILGGDSTRRALEKMPPEHQLKAVRLAEAAGTLSGGMSPGTAVLALAASVVAPGMFAKARDVIHKIMRHKD